jgi:AcrR family transcriptional regulator
MILQTALELFNTQGSRTITTNHIAKGCGISPGNLYYYFKNKEEIIRALYNQMVREWDEYVTAFTAFDMSVFAKIIEHSNTVFRHYRFIHNELYALCQNDPALDEMNRKRLQIKKATVQQMIELLIQHEGFEPLDKETLELLVDAVLMFALFWLPYQEMTSANGTQHASLNQTKALIERFLKKKN